jgi:hypothetical protein
MRRLASSVANLLFFGIDRHQLPTPTAIASSGKQGDDIAELALARGASARCIVGYPMPFIDVYLPSLEEVERMCAIGARILLCEAAQDELTLPVESWKILPLGR